MKHIIHAANPEKKYKIALLIKELSFNKSEIEKYYVAPLVKLGIPAYDIITISLEYTENNKAPVSLIKDYAATLVKTLHRIGNPTLLVADAAYFKTIVGERKADPHFGYIKPCKLPGWETMNAVLSVNFSGLIYNPVIQDKLTMSLETISNHIKGFHPAPGTDIIHSAKYIDHISDAVIAFQELHKCPALTVDIETYSLHTGDNIGSIGFAWNKHNGIVVSLLKNEQSPQYRKGILNLLKKFFTKYKGTCIYHGGTFDIKHIIKDVFMSNPSHISGMINGLNIMTKNIHDTLLMTFLATNTTAENKLDLKSNAHEFAGNYAQDDITDISKIPSQELFEYNLIDCLSTWYLVEKYFPVVHADNQICLYDQIYIPSMKVIIQMELIGMPIDLEQVYKLETTLSLNIQGCETLLELNADIVDFTKKLQLKELLRKNSTLKVKVMKEEDFYHIKFNPNSNPQVADLLHDHWGLPIIDTTPKGQPQVGVGTLEKIRNHATNRNQKKIIDALIKIQKTSIIKNTFLRAFKANSFYRGKTAYLHGGFNLTGTKSGRMSSSKPNLQNIPSTGTDYADAIKECFIAPPGWLMVGADYASLEDRISALTTRDPNKIKVYTDGYDGHCLRAFTYFGSQMPDIVDSVKSINSIKTKYPDLRQKSKGPTFALTYQGTSHALVNNIGLDPKEAYQIEAGYHELYKVSDQWVESKLSQASSDGYITGAFGLRLRTPILKQIIKGKRSTPFLGSAEARTAGNALGQSYGLLNNRSGIEIQERILNSPYAEKILPICQIHDSQYFIIKNEVGTVKWFNDNLINTMEWQKLPELQHPTVGLGGQLAIYFPNWAHETKLPNNATKKEIYDLCNQTRI